MPSRAEHLAKRVEMGAQDLIEAIQHLTAEQWQTPVDGEQRTVGVLVHHVGTMYPLEASVVQTLAAEGAMPGLEWDGVDSINADHATAHAGVDKDAAITLIRENSAKAADVVRGLSDEKLDRIAPNALHWGAPMTVQFFVEHHPIAHPYIHLESIKAALGQA